MYSFIQHNNFEIHSYRCIYQQSVPFYYCFLLYKYTIYIILHLYQSYFSSWSLFMMWGRVWVSLLFHFYRQFFHCHFVTSTGILHFPKTEIRRKPQKNFQMHFIKVMLEHRGGSTEERKGLQTDSDLALPSCFYKLGTRKLARKSGLFESGKLLKKDDFLYLAKVPGNYVLSSTVWTRWQTAHYCCPRKVL